MAPFGVSPRIGGPADGRSFRTSIVEWVRKSENSRVLLDAEVAGAQPRAGSPRS